MIKINNVEVNEEELIKLGWTAPKQPEKKYGRQRVETGESFHFINAIGHVTSLIDGRDIVCDRLFKLGNYYLTEQEATHARDVKEATRRVNDAIDKINEGWEPDWSDPDKEKFFIRHNTPCESPNEKLGVHWTRRYKDACGLSYVQSAEKAKEIISKHKDDLLLIFGVK